MDGKGNGKVTYIFNNDGYEIFKDGKKIGNDGWRFSKTKQLRVFMDGEKTTWRISKNFLALSSRNYLLSKNELNKAGKIAKYLFKLKSTLKNNNQIHNNILIKKKELQKKFNIKIDYLEIRNEKNLYSLIKNKKIRLFVAYYINKVRLIDNF